MHATIPHSNVFVNFTLTHDLEKQISHSNLGTPFY